MDANALRLFWSQAGQPDVSWLLIAPPDVTSITLPELPAGRVGFLASANAPRSYVTRFSSSLQEGYRAFLAEPARPVLEEAVTQPLARDQPSEGLYQAVTYDPN